MVIRDISDVSKETQKKIFREIRRQGDKICIPCALEAVGIDIKTNSALVKSLVKTLKWRQKPNNTYKRESISPDGEKTNYVYKTDDYGRIKSVEGQLILNKAARNKHQQRNVGKEDGRVEEDAGGHLIGSQFGGVGTSENLVAMNHAQVNAYPSGDFGALEKRWADSLNDGNKVHVKIEPVYLPNNTTSRPDRFKITERITTPDGSVKEKKYKISNKDE
ncbi:hypothetical protein GCM10028807_60650 [Spirosoma daeguense]